MLKSLKIKNIALIEDLEVSFEKGLNILSGETGAGKSIIIDSVEFVLGKRADKSLIRYGCEKAEVTAEFYVENNTALFAIMDDFGIEREDTLLISRIMTADSNVCRVNGVKITLGMLKNLTSALADIYGQHETAELLDEKKHLAMLDSFMPEVLAPYKAEVLNLYNERKALKRELAAYGSSKELAKNLDIIEYQIKEINDAKLEDGEEEKLSALRSKLNNAESFISALSETEFLLAGFENEYNAYTSVSAALQNLNKISFMDGDCAAIAERLENVKIELSDIASEVSSIAQNSEFDEGLARVTEERWELIKSLKRKYGTSIAEILSYGEKLTQDFDFYNNSEERVAQLESKLEDNNIKLYNACCKLTEARKEQSKLLANKLLAELDDVGMKNVVFETAFNSYDIENRPEYSSNGLDEAVFYISINKGQPLKSLAKTISGGEMSRFMLCFKTITAEVYGVNTMIFDEIDTGISGVAAEKVAQKMFKIAKNAQVLAVTHIAQIAAMADSHYLISKNSDENNTFTLITKLDEQQENLELARLISGSSSQIAIAHATEMKLSANFFKTN